MPGPFAIIPRFEALPGRGEELHALLRESAAIALEEEPGCSRFEILQGADDEGNPLPEVFMSNELFDDYEAVEAHRNSWRTPIRRDRIRALSVSRTRIELGVVEVLT